jgi:hypothetical protein
MPKDCKLDFRESLYSGVLFPDYGRHMKFRQKAAYAERDLNFEIRNQLNS